MSLQKQINQVSLSKGVLFTLIGRMIVEVIAFLSTKIFASILSLSDYGKISVYGTWSAILTAFISLQVTGSIGNARIHYSDDDMDCYLSSMMFLTFFSFTAFFCGFFIFSKQIALFVNVRRDLVFLMVIHSYCSFCVAFFEQWLVQYKHADKSTLVNVVTALSGIAISLILVVLSPGEKYIYKLYGTAIPYIILGPFVLFFFLKKGRFCLKWDYCRFSIFISLPLVFHYVGNLILEQSDRIMLQRIIGDEYAGLYSLACTMSMVMTAIFFSFNSVWTSFYFDFKKNDSIQPILEKSKSYLMNVTVIFVGFILLVPEVFKFITPSNCWNVGLLVIPILVLAEYFRFLYLFPSNHELFYKKTKFVGIVTVFVSGLNIILNFIFIRKFQVLGAACTTCFSSIILFTLNYLVSKYVIKKFEYNIFFFMPYFLFFLFFFLIYYIFLFFFPELWWIRWCIGGTLGILLLLRVYNKKSLF